MVITLYGGRWLLDYCGDHFIMQANVKSLCRTPETNIILYNCISVKRKHKFYSDESFQVNIWRKVTQNKTWKPISQANKKLRVFRVLQRQEDKHQQHVKKQRHHFANKIHIVKAMVFLVQMWELDHKEGWVPKNWCFWTVVLEKILESPLGCKEIKPLNPKGNQP